MDEPILDRRPSASFGPDRRLTGACGAGALLGIVLTLSISDAPGRLLLGLATALLAAYVATDLLYSPRLVVDADGVRVHSPFTRAQWTWPELERVQADGRLRYGLRTVTLEIDAGEQLVVLSRRALGESPELVAEIVASFAPRP